MLELDEGGGDHVWVLMIDLVNIELDPIELHEIISDFIYWIVVD